MLTTPKLRLTAVLAVLFAASFTVSAEDPAALQKELESKYALTTINAEGGVVTQGVSLTLKKTGLTAGPKSCTLEYKNGTLALVGSSRATCNSGKSGGLLGGLARGTVLGLGSAAGAQAARLFVPGEKLYLTSITIASDAVIFTLVSDAINNVTYNADVRFRPKAGASPDFAEADRLITEVFSAAPPDNQQAAQQPASAAPASQASGPALAPIPPPPPPQDKLADIPPPPPPPDQPPPTVSMGQSTDQVVAILGQPLKIADLGKKKIYSYKDVKVTFVDGKVTDVQ